MLLLKKPGRQSRRFEFEGEEMRFREELEEQTVRFRGGQSPKKRSGVGSVGRKISIF